jgi:putative hydrolase of the HAD superfamily
MPLRAVLFDAAGTLIHLREPVGVTYGRLARAHGVTASVERIGQAFGGILPGMPAMAFPGAPPAAVVARERAWWRDLVRRTFAAAEPGARFDDFDAYFDALFASFAHPSAWEVVDEALATLAHIRRQGLMTGVVSNFDHRLPGLLDGLGLAPLLDVVIRPADIGAAKPDARIFHAALDRLGVAPGDALYVGDDEDEDLRGAQAAGLRALNVAALPRFGALLDLVPSS